MGRRVTIDGRHLWVLAGLAFASAVGLPTEVEAELRTVTIGQNGDLNWKGEGTAPLDILPAQHRLALDPNRIVVGNAPGQRVELDSKLFPGALHVLEITEADITHGTVERGGDIDVSGWTGGWQQGMVVQAYAAEVLNRNEGDEKEALEVPENSFGLRIHVDLGGRFGVSRIRFYPRNTVQPSPTTPFQDRTLRHFVLNVNDGVLLTEHGSPKYDLLLRESQNENPVVDIGLDPPRILQHLELIGLTGIPWELDEVEVHGQGFLPDGRYVSNIFDAGEAVAWSSLRWAEEVINAPGLSKMEIRTRTGNDDSPFVFHRRLFGQSGAEDIPFAIDSDTEEMTQKEYNGLPKADSRGRTWNPGNVEDDRVNWSPLSPPYSAAAAAGAGIPILSPSPRRYFQFQVSLKGSDLAAARVLKDLSFIYASPALADSLRGEIYPRVADVSDRVHYTYSVLATLRSRGLTGFDVIRIGTPSRVEEIISVELLDAAGEPLASHSFAGLGDTTLVDGFRILAVEDDGFALQFPPVRESATRIDVRFNTRVFTYSTRFPARVGLQSEESAFQAVEPGDVGILGPGDDAATSGTTVLSPQVLGWNRLLDAVAVQPNPFTPNGDGVNDELSVRYDLVSVTAATPVAIRVYDLAGRQVATVSESVEGSGRYKDKTWDGRDAGGNLLAPGVYLIRIEVDGDAENAEQAKVVSLVY